MFNWPKVVSELRAWAEAGLIPGWTLADNSDEVLAEVLKAVRLFMSDRDAS